MVKKGKYLSMGKGATSEFNFFIKKERKKERRSRYKLRYGNRNVDINLLKRVHHNSQVPSIIINDSKI
jgi:hypothetical protein